MYNKCCCNNCKYFKYEPHNIESKTFLGNKGKDIEFDGYCKLVPCEAPVFDCRIDTCANFSEKPVEWKKNGDYLICPNCNYEEVESYGRAFKFCPMCGVPFKENENA